MVLGARVAREAALQRARHHLHRSVVGAEPEGRVGAGRPLEADHLTPSIRARLAPQMPVVDQALAAHVSE